ncbi:MAG: HAD family hydrolase [Bryobacteraceae bacterium]
MSSYEAVLFDFDGVLVDSEPVHFSCWQEILKPFGVLLDWDTYYANCIGVSDRAMIESLCACFGPTVPFDRLWAQYPRKKELFRARMQREFVFASEIIELLESLRDYRLAVVSSSGRNEVEPVLESAGIRSRFQAAIFGEDVTRLKPAPDPYLLAMKRLNVQRALVVEDSDAGVASAHAAGLDVLRIPAQSEVPRLVKEKLGLR